MCVAGPENACRKQEGLFLPEFQRAQSDRQIVSPGLADKGVACAREMPSVRARVCPNRSLSPVSAAERSLS
jgi:hypothetical protein